MYPPEDSVSHFQRVVAGVLERAGDYEGHGREPGDLLCVGHQTNSPHEDIGYHEGRDHDEGEQAVEVERQSFRLGDQPSPERHHHAYYHQQLEYIHERYIDRAHAAGYQRVYVSLLKAFADESNGPEGYHDETPEYEHVHDPCIPLVEHTPLSQDVNEHTQYPFVDLVKPVFPNTFRHQPEPVSNAVDEYAQRRRQHNHHYR